MLVPLVAAAALFMENLDATVIATSLPAIARDLHQDPVILKLAFTSYLIALAVFIPVSGWAADRFGARTCSAAPSSFHPGIGCLRLRQLARMAGGRPRRPGPGRRHDDTGRPADPAALGAEERAGPGAGLSHHPGAAGAAGRPAGRRVHHHLFPLAVDLLDQHSGRRARPGACHPLHAGCQGRPRAAARLAGLLPFGPRARGHHLRLHHHRRRGPAAPGGTGADHRRGGARRPLCPACAARAAPDPRSAPVPHPDLPLERGRRHGVPHRHRLDPVSPAADAAGRLRPQSLPIRLIDLRRRGRRAGDEIHRPADPASFRLPPGAGVSTP